MPETNTLARTLHDLGLATWFGGSLFGAAALNPASEELESPKDRLHAANAGWGRWTPVNLAAIAAHLAGGAVVTWGNKARMSGQKGVARRTAVKTGLTAAALGATAYSRKLGQEVMEYETELSRGAGQGPAAEGGTTPSAQTPAHVADAQQKLKAMQWAVPALTGAVMAVNVRMGEQQRPVAIAKGVFGRLTRS
jgi:hypothetical protein